MKKILYVFLSVAILVCSIGALQTSAATTTSYAYSIGTLYTDGSDFTNNVKVAADIYGTISGFRSYYENTPTYDYLTGNNANGVPRLASEIVFLNGHANSSAIGLNYSGGSFDVTINYNSASTNKIGLRSFDMSSCKLISFVGCSTAAGTTNLPSVAVAQGAKSAIGFTDSIYSRFYNGPDWLRVFNNRIAAGYTVDEAIASACRAYPNDSLTQYVKRYGNGSVVPAASNLSTASLRNEDYALYHERVVSKNTYTVNDADTKTALVSIGVNDFDVSNYRITYNNFAEDDSNKKTMAVAIYMISDEIETNAAYFLNYENDNLVTIGWNDYVENIEEIDTNAICNAVETFKATNTYKNMGTTSFDGKAYEDTFYYDISSGNLVYRAWTSNTVMRNNGESFEEPVAVEISITLS